MILRTSKTWPKSFRSIWILACRCNSTLLLKEGYREKRRARHDAGLLETEHARKCLRRTVVFDSTKSVTNDSLESVWTAPPSVTNRTALPRAAHAEEDRLSLHYANDKVI
jgi:hypothetical protein